jgi:phosphatidylglycerol:prolipoprotein diacylglycerol transferase
MFPRIFTIGSFSLHTYGVLVVAAFVTGLLVATRLAASRGLDRNRVFDLGVYVALAAIAGAKVLMVLENLPYYLENPRAIFSVASLQSAGVFYGGFLAALGTAAWYMHRHGLPFFETADAFVPGVALGHGIGRLGCFAAGCCWGHPTSLPWAVTFTDPYAHDIVGVPLGVPLHPAQLYEFAALLLIFAVLMAVWKRRSFEGQVLSLYLMLYGVARFALEFTRDRSDNGMPWGLVSVSQGIALLLALAGLAIWLSRRRAPLLSSVTQHS